MPPTEIPRKVWTQADVQTLLDVGFPNANRLELIEGDLIDHMGKKPPHVLWQMLIRDWLIQVFGSERVQTESPFEIAGGDQTISQPEPDVMVTKSSIRAYRDTPDASEIVLLVEIADTSLKFDLGVKAELYARAGIADYWVLDVSARMLVVHRQPVDGNYESVTRNAAGDQVRPLVSSPSMSLNQLI